MEYFNTALDLHKRVNPKEVIVGWYSTGTEISYASSLVHQIFKEKLPNPVLLTIDVAMKNARMGVKAYRGKQFGIGDKGVIYRFEDAELELEAYEAEKIGGTFLLCTFSFEFGRSRQMKCGASQTTCHFIFISSGRAHQQRSG